MATDRARHAEVAGLRAVAMAVEVLTPEWTMTPAAFTNNFHVLIAVGGFTNAPMHMTTVSGRLGMGADLAAIDRLGRAKLGLVDLKPSGRHYYGRSAQRQRDDCGATRVGAAPRFSTASPTVAAHWARTSTWLQSVVRRRTDPIYFEGGLAAPTGSLASGEVLHDRVDLVVHADSAGHAYDGNVREIVEPVYPGLAGIQVSDQRIEPGVTGVDLDAGVRLSCRKLSQLESHVKLQRIAEILEILTYHAAGPSACSDSAH